MKCVLVCVAYAALNLNANSYGEAIQQLRHETFISDHLVGPAVTSAEKNRHRRFGCSSIDGPVCFSDDASFAQLADGFFSVRLSPGNDDDHKTGHSLEFPATYAKSLFPDYALARRDRPLPSKHIRRHQSRAVCLQLDFESSFVEANGVHLVKEPPFRVDWLGRWRTVQGNVNGTRQSFSAVEIHSAFASIKFGKEVALMSISMARRCTVYNMTDATPIVIIGRNGGDEVFSETVYPWELAETFVNGIFFHAVTQAQSVNEVWFLLGECVQIKNIRLAHSERDERRRSDASFLLTFRDGWKAFDVADMQVGEVVDHNAPLWSLHELVEANRRLFQGVRMETPGTLGNSTNAENKLGIAAPYPSPAEHVEWVGSSRLAHKLLKMLTKWNPVYERDVDMLEMLSELNSLLSHLRVAQTQGRQKGVHKVEDTFGDTWRALGLPHLTMAYFRYSIARRHNTAKPYPGVFDYVLKRIAAQFEKELKLEGKQLLGTTLSKLLKNILGSIGHVDVKSKSEVWEDTIEDTKFETEIEDDDGNDEEEMEVELSVEDTPVAPKGDRVDTDTVSDAGSASERSVANKVASRLSLQERLASIEDASEDQLAQLMEQHGAADAVTADQGEPTRVATPPSTQARMSSLSKKISGVFADEGNKETDDTDDVTKKKPDVAQGVEAEDSKKKKKKQNAKPKLAIGMTVITNGNAQQITGTSVEDLLRKVENSGISNVDGIRKEVQKAFGAASAGDGGKQRSDRSGSMDTDAGTDTDTDTDEDVHSADEIASMLGNWATAIDAEELNALIGGKGGVIQMKPEQLANLVASDDQFDQTLADILNPKREADTSVDQTHDSTHAQAHTDAHAEHHALHAQATAEHTDAHAEHHTLHAQATAEHRDAHAQALAGHAVVQNVPHGATDRPATAPAPDLGDEQKRVDTLAYLRLLHGDDKAAQIEAVLKAALTGDTSASAHGTEDASDRTRDLVMENGARRTPMPAVYEFTKPSAADADEDSSANPETLDEYQDEITDFDEQMGTLEEMMLNSGTDFTTEREHFVDTTDDKNDGL